MVSSSDITPSTRFKLGDWQVDPNTGRLIKGETEVKLEPRVMEVLVYLAQNSGNVVSREALEARVWAGMVVGYDAVAGTIIKLRKALGDDSRNPKYIKTISKKGYQLIAPVTLEIEDFHEPPISSRTNAADKISPTNERKIKHLANLFGVTVIVALLLFLTNKPETENIPANTLSTLTSVVVLPFKNLSNDPQQEYFSDGITDDLITDLSRLDSVRVIARQSSYYYKNNPASLKDIAEQLNALYIVEGSIRKSGDRIRVNVQLTNTQKDQSIWAERFDVAAGDIFKIQDDITKNVMEAMLVTLKGSRNVPSKTRGTNNFDAYDAFLLGQQTIKSRSRQGYELTMNAYRRAIDFDPSFARTYGAMAVALTRGYRYQWTDLSLTEARQRALELAEKAVALNQSTPQIYWSLSYVHLHRHEYNAAEKAAKQSVTISPNYADGYALLANIANWRGKANDAVKYIQKATSLNPHYTFQYPSILGLAYYQLGEYNKAVDALKQSLARNENALNPRLFLAASYTRLDFMDEAAWEIEQIIANKPNIGLSNLSTVLPFEHKELLDPLVTDLRKAGLPG